MDLLLDTCTFLWLAQQPGSISESAVRAIDDPENVLYLSEASLLEIVMKHRVGRLPLPDLPRRWITQKLEYHRIEPLSIESESIYLSGEIRNEHSDPFDRLIVARAIAGNLTIVSPDAALSLLGAARLW